jgi:hypothetical protein
MKITETSNKWTKQVYKFYNDAHRWKKFKILEEYYFLLKTKKIKVQKSKNGLFGQNQN